MTKEDFENVLKVGEHSGVEFKRGGNGAQYDTFETICAFLNRFGGDIFLGVTDDGKVVGVPEGEVRPIINHVIKTMNNGTLFEPVFAVFPEPMVYRGKHVVRIHVPASSTVHRYRGVCYDRIDESDIKVSATEMIAQMYIRKQNIFTEKRIFPYIKKKHLRLDLLPKIRRLAANSSRDEQHPWLVMDDEALFHSAGLISEDCTTGKPGFNAAAVLLLGKDDVIRNCFPAYKTDAIMRRVNVDRYDDRDTIQTNLVEAYDRLMTFGAKHLNDKFFLEGDVRISLVNKILREVVGNLLIHREYSSSRPGRFVIERGQMFADNANKALHHGVITLANLDPQPKNPIIANFFHQIGRADELGSGVRNLFHYAKLYSGGSPVFDEGDIFRTTVPLNDVGSQKSSQKSSRKSSQESSQESSHKGSFRKHGFNRDETEKRILSLLGMNPSMTGESIANCLGITRRAVTKQIAGLKSKGLLHRIGPDKGGYWEVVK